MTFQDIETGVYRRLNKSLAPDPVTQARIQEFINDRYRQLLREGGIDIRDETLNIITEANRARYALPSTVTEIYNVFDTTNRIKLRHVSLAEIRRRDPSVPAQISGTSWGYAILNEAGIGLQPTITTPGALTLVSTSPLDTMTGVLELAGGGINFNVVPFTLTGVVPVVLPFDVTEVFRIQLATSPNGRITLTQTGPPAVELATFGGELYTALHKWVIHFWPTPAGPYTMSIDFARPRRPLVDPGDEPAIPEEFHTLLVDGACAEESIKMDDTRARTYEQKYREGVRRFRAFLHQGRGQRWIPKRGRRGWNDLGGFFPSYNDGGW